MKVHIGPYLTWWGPYQIADLLTYIGVSEARSHKIGKWLADTWVSDVCQWIQDRKKRVIKVRIDSYDTWSADSTLAYVIAPVLRKLYEDGPPCAPFTDDEDVPEYLRSTADSEWSIDNLCKDGSTDKFFHERWKYIVGEMVYAFESIIDERVNPYDDVNKRQDNGLRLFGKYYRGLWT